MIEYNKERIMSGLSDYEKIMELAQKIDVSVDIEFQKLFNKYYQVNPKSKEWLSNFYKLFQKAKANNYDFETVLNMFYKKMKRVELSFCSKMIHTINPKNPVVDQYILWKMGFNPKESLRGKPERAIIIYNDICKQYDTHMSDEAVVDVLKKFDNDFSDYTAIENIKKLDFIFWSDRESRIHSVFEYEKALQ